MFVKRLKQLAARLLPTKNKLHPGASRERYLALWAEAKARSSRAVEQFVERVGFDIDREWLDTLALRTQVTIKKSQLDYNHGKVLYAVVRQRLATYDNGLAICFETGTARGFSAVVIARAIRDSGVPGVVFTVDVIPHDVPRFWNCVADLDGPRSRRELLADWSDECQLIQFNCSRSTSLLSRTGLPRIAAAFLDGAHDERTVGKEYEYVANLQQTGDVIIFDDVTTGAFPGICRVVNSVKSEGRYQVDYLESSETRGYAVCTRL